MLKNIIIGFLVVFNIVLLYLVFIKNEYIFKNEKIIKINKNFIDIYPEFYQDRYLFEMNNNHGYLINNQEYLKLLLKDTLLANSFIDTSYDFCLDFNDLVLNKINRNYDPTYILYRNYSYSLLDYNIFDIEFPLDSNAKNKFRIFLLNKKKTQNFYAFYIKWINKDAIGFSNLNQNSKELYPPQEGYIWGINKTTDTLFTNLNYYTIKKLFNDFKGEYIFKKYRKIEVKGNCEIYEDNINNFIEMN